MRALVPAALLLVAAFAGCIAPPEDVESASTSSTPPPVDERVQGMTAEETSIDAVARCEDGGAIQIPPRMFCATRHLEVTGRMGEADLPVDLRSLNGAITLSASVGDTWSFTVDYEVEAPTEDMARDGLDTAWTWSHEGPEGHHLKAGPTTDLSLLTARLTHATYLVTLPRWTLLDVTLLTTNGEITLEGLATTALSVTTTNGEIDLDADVIDVDAKTTNGEITARLRPTATGSVDLASSNGEVTLGVPETNDRGYSVHAKTTNGEVTLALRDGTVEQTDENEARFETTRLSDRAIQTTVTIQTTNGEVDVTPE